MEIETVPVLLKVPLFDIHYEPASILVQSSLSKNGLDFRENSVRLTELDIVAIWKHVPAPILIALIEKLAGRLLCAWMVQGENAISRVNQLKGEYTDPEKCALSTWRRRLTDMLGPRKIGLYSPDGTLLETAVENYIHSPSLAELPVHMEVFGKFFPQ